MSIRRDLKGARFGRLVVLRWNGRDKQSRYLWECQCDCGTVKTIPSRHLMQGNIVSCGCYMAEKSAENGKRTAHKISGPRSYLYKPHLTDEERKVKRNLVEMREWRKKVYERDDYTCDLCGTRGGRLEAHHLNSWAEHRQSRFDVANGVCLCKICHHDFHMAHGGPRHPCTADQYYDFKFGATYHGC